MKIHEFQAKQVLAKYGVDIPNGEVAKTVDEAKFVSKNLKSKIYVVKAQIHAGGRGKSGGIKICKSINEVTEFSKQILGKKLVTKQTGKDGQIIRSGRRSRIYC